MSKIVGSEAKRMKHHQGDLSITKENASEVRALTTVGGCLFIHADAPLSNLTSVGGRLVITAGRFDIEAEVSLPALTSVHGAAMPDLAVAHERLVAVARQVVAHPETFNMYAWHCGTRHCVGGWAIEQAGELGQNLTVLHGVQVAATLLLGVSGAQLFYLSNEAAMAKLTTIASAQGPS